jgi:PhnB protein
VASKVNPIPDGMHSVTPHLVIRGAAEAIEFYKKAFNAEEVFRMPAADGKRVMHAEIKIGDSIVFLADEFPEMGGSCRSPATLGGSSVTLNLYVHNVDAAFNQAVAAGAKVGMPPMDMFWGDRYCKVTDPFGHDWSMAQHIEDVPHEELARRAEAFNKQMAQQPAGAS